MHRAIIYRARDGWRWHLRARNGKIIAESGEAYTRRWDARLGLKRVAAAFRLTVPVDIEGDGYSTRKYIWQ